MWLLVGDVVLSERRAVNCVYYLACFALLLFFGSFWGFQSWRSIERVADRGPVVVVDKDVMRRLYLSMWWTVYSVLYFGVGFKLQGLYDIELSLLESRGSLVKML